MKSIRLAALLALLAVVPVAAHAQSTITACYVPKTGSMYRIQAAGAPDACKSNHVEFSWQSGGVIYTNRWHPSVVVHPNTYEQVFASCEAGESLTGGGYATVPNGIVSVAANAPSFTPNQPASWFIDLRNLDNLDIQMTAYVICAKPAT